jgi:hypothetical protein
MNFKIRRSLRNATMRLKVSATVDAMVSQRSIYLFNVCVLMKFDLKFISFSLFSPKVSNFDFKILISGPVC